MLCLGIECTAHTFGAAVVEYQQGKEKNAGKAGKLQDRVLPDRDACKEKPLGKVLSNEKAMFTTEHGGMIPTEVGEHHRKVKDKVIAAALEKAGKSFDDIDLISVSNAPGLAPALIAGLEAAKELSEKHNIPLIGVNHCVAHLEIVNLLTSAKYRSINWI